MLFNSYIFLFLFLPLALGGWYFLNHLRLHSAALLFLSAMSLWFYAYFNPSYLLIILASIAVNYTLSGLLAALETRPAAGLFRRVVLVGGVGLNLALFFYFKYFDFFLENINAVFHTDYPLRHILLPLGISFFTFQQLSFLIDRCRGEAKHYPFPEYLTFVTFFPQLIAGPIVLYDEMMPQFADLRNRRFCPQSFARGIVLFVIGLAKKVLLADALAVPANYGFAMTWYMDTLTTALVLLSYTFELYFDFSGYCDMAMGIAAMFNITLPLNFRSPYRAASIREFWQRWHMTLQRFFTRYVYHPLGGSRGGTARTIRNILIVFALSGLWHGAAWTFLAWGLMHGLLTIWDGLGIMVPSESGEAKRRPRYFLRHAPLLVIPRGLGNALTMLFFMLSLIFFRSESMAAALEMFRTLLRFRFPGYLCLTAQNYMPAELYVINKLIAQRFPAMAQPAALIRWLLLLLLSAWIIFTRRSAPEIAETAVSSRRVCFVLPLLFVWSVISLSGVSTFLYFNF
ncbi:MBOAT family O-acyltransferase [Lachnoclostridium sp. Marseille-P6806]|uniref:MBOAT family O-acyltransferase n=1 Tax=Lachnoclostridium sp. Marseille-P6806 TaxID=2364793 RepID=UPI00102FBDCD|nr:MBOAT family O-acyltransferase [Lachnoclostridium sp. Marseille-P6806]